MNVTPQGACDNSPSGQRDGDAEVEGSESDEAPVTAVRQVGVGGDEIPELFSPLHESADGKSWSPSSK
jgi:hypothetical protein